MSNYLRGKHHVKHGGTTNEQPDSLVKVNVTNDSGEWVRPNTGERFYIDEVAKFPSIIFEIKTSATPPYEWKWRIDWSARVSGLREEIRRGRRLKIFSEAGNFSSNHNLWEADLNEKIIGGKLTVTVKAGNTIFRRTVVVLGKNPTEVDVKKFIMGIPNAAGLELLIKQESLFKQFINCDGEPVVAGDGGYGIAQLTNPMPTYQQAWSWKENIRGCARLFHEKQVEAARFLGQDGRAYTSEQLAMEAISRWNGGKYHSWNDKTQSWERNPDVLCDPASEGIGWDINDEKNLGKSTNELHERDKDTYGKMKAGQSAEHDWMYSGVCYADHITRD